MTHNRHHNSNCLCCILILLTISFVTKGDLQDYLNLQHGIDLEPKRFSDISDGDEQDETNNDPMWSGVPARNVETVDVHSTGIQSKVNISFSLDPNIIWDRRWDTAMLKYDLGQLSACSIDINGNIALFTRRERIWGQGTFDLNEVFDVSRGPIRQNTIILFNKNGDIVLEWGRDMFYLPHGLTIDSAGNYWLTDVAMHQVFKFNAKDIEKNLNALKQMQYRPRIESSFSIPDVNNLLSNSILKPSLILGEAFKPGNDNTKFCKPTAVAVALNGDFFVSDGYCNSRLIKFNSQGERITTIGRGIRSSYMIGEYSLLVPHALALADELNLIYVADREHGRILCYYAQNGSFHKEYKSPMFGDKIYGIAYAHERLYLVNGPNPYRSKFHVRGYILDIHTGEIVSQFGPDGDMIAPHAIAVSKDTREIYVPELNKRLYRFSLENRSTALNFSSTLTTLANISSASSGNLMTNDPKNNDKSVTRGRAEAIVLTCIISIVLIIGIGFSVAAVVYRCRKRGCSLSARRRGYWSKDDDDDFKLSRILTGRQGGHFRIFDKRPNTKNFSKLNTEPETSDDEHLEDSLII